MSDLVAIDAYLSMLAKNGVKKIGPLGADGNQYPEVELHDRGAPTLPEAIIPKAMTQNAPHMEDTCACGHLEHTHMGGVCAIGCHVEKCARGKSGDAPTKA